MSIVDQDPLIAALELHRPVDADVLNMAIRYRQAQIRELEQDLPPDHPPTGRNRQFRINVVYQELAILQRRLRDYEGSPFPSEIGNSRVEAP